MSKMTKEDAEVAASRYVDFLIKNQPSLLSPAGSINPMLQWEDGSAGRALAANIKALHAGLVEHLMSIEV